MKLDLFRLGAVIVPLLPLLLLVQAVACSEADAGGRANCAGNCEMPALPRLPRG